MLGDQQFSVCAGRFLQRECRSWRSCKADIRHTEQLQRARKKEGWGARVQRLSPRSGGEREGGSQTSSKLELFDAVVVVGLRPQDSHAVLRAARMRQGGVVHAEALMRGDWDWRWCNALAQCQEMLPNVSLFVVRRKLVDAKGAAAA